MTDPAEFEASPIHDCDPHERVDIGETLENLTVVIPTNRDENYTLASLPSEVDSVIASDDGLNVARNRGIERADSEWIALVDDDITFPTKLTAMFLDGMHKHHLVGLEDYWPMRYVLGRYMLFHRSLWRSIGGFDESRPHGGDTDFCIRALDDGANIVRLPRHMIPHHDAASDFSTITHAEWLWYLVRRHPKRIMPKAVKLAARKLGLVSPHRVDYPDGWQSSVWVPPDATDSEEKTSPDRRPDEPY